jgi:hypothetical protein
MIKKALEFVVRQLAQKPEDVHIQEQRSSEERAFKIYVASEDVKRVIGKEGRVIKSLRSLVKALGADEHHRYLVDVVQ